MFIWSKAVPKLKASTMSLPFTRLLRNEWECPATTTSTNLFISAVSSMISPVASVGLLYCPPEWASTTMALTP